MGIFKWISRRRLGGATHADQANHNLSVGRYTYGHESLTILDWGEGAKLRIGAFCSIAQSVEIFLGGNHRVDWATTFPFGHIFRNELGGEGILGHPATRGDVIIGNDVWLGRGARIMSGITIGDGAVVAAGALVVRDIAPYEIWGGNPARRIRIRFAPDIVDGLLDLKWWTWPEHILREAAALLSQPPDHVTLAALRKLNP